MFNDLAGKFLSIVSVKGQDENSTTTTTAINNDLENGQRRNQIQDNNGYADAAINEEDQDDFDEWVLLDDEDQDIDGGSSISDDVDLLLSPDGGGDNDSTTTTSNTDIDVLSPPDSRAADSSMHRSSGGGWQLTPPPCFTASSSSRGRNKYKHAKHRNANLAPKRPDAAQALMSDLVVTSNLLIEHPDPAGLRLYRRRVLGVRQFNYAPVADLGAAERIDSMNGVADEKLGAKSNLSDVSGASAGDKENALATSVVGSVTTPVYVVIGENVCAKKPASYGRRLEIDPRLQQRAASGGAGCRRAKRQHFTVYDPCVFGANKLDARGRQRKQRGVHNRKGQ